ncbi:metalloreductase STEAP4 [Labeo rohita]|uniref:Metalloreductase STEAP4 n=1 Tax=Labeo rohita TaxID=84645 RepID=A0A498P0B5_LABRO|nr:metalloreductase STEAP4 [Labeo rohita]
MNSNSVAMTDLSEMKHKLETVCIFGTGDFGRSLGLRLLQSGYGVVYGSRGLKNSLLLPKGSKIMSHAEAACEAHVIFVAVQREHYGFLSSLASDLEGKVLVDVSNNLKRGLYPESNAEYLSKLVPGATVLICGDSADAKQQVTNIAQSLSFTALDRGSLRAAAELEDLPLQLFPLWRLPLNIAICLTAFIFFYVLTRIVIYERVTNGKDIAFRIMISLANKAFPIVSLVMLSLCYLPGALAGFLQLYNGTKYRRFPDWLDRWMLCRKQLGLVALAFGFLHVLYTLVIPIRYYVRYRINVYTISLVKDNKTYEFDNTAAWRFDSYYSMGILGFGLFVLLGITSLPSVSNSLNWREFRFVQSKLGYLTLLLCTAHTFLYGWNRFLNPESYRWWMPPAYMLSLVVPCVVLILKLILITPCVDRKVTRIRQGWERQGKTSANGGDTKINQRLMA